MRTNLEIIEALVNEIKDKLAKYGYNHIPVTFGIDKLSPRIAGRAFYRTNHISISEYYLAEHPDHIFDVTIAHEICHLYVNTYYPRAKQHHGPEFRRLMNFLGLRGDTYHKLKLESVEVPRRTKTRYVYLAEGTYHEVYLTTNQHKRMQKDPQRYVSKTTRSSLVFSGKVVQWK